MTNEAGIPDEGPFWHMETIGEHTIRYIRPHHADTNNEAPADHVDAELMHANYWARKAAEIDAQLRHSVDRCRTHGASWAQIGEELGISKQAAQQRYGKTS